MSESDKEFVERYAQSYGWAVPDRLLSLARKGAEADALRAEVEKWKQLDREAATHVESVICMKSNRFTGDPPYVGWKGLGLALREDYDELSALRARIEKLEGALKWYADKGNHEGRLVTAGCECCTDYVDAAIVDDMGERARTALGDTHE